MAGGKATSRNENCVYLIEWESQCDRLLLMFPLKRSHSICVSKVPGASCYASTSTCHVYRSPMKFSNRSTNLEGEKLTLNLEVVGLTKTKLTHTLEHFRRIAIITSKDDWVSFVQNFERETLLHLLLICIAHVVPSPILAVDVYGWDIVIIKSKDIACDFGHA